MIKRNATTSRSVNICNSAQQGGLLSPLLFNVYLDKLISLLREQGVGCHMTGMLVGLVTIIKNRPCVRRNLYST